ncbi:hypothetical protein F4604DRAFT_1961344 [Suillus subluteus]|nr:hypothetical protein F4604DRAFT_1961344 [Suillus subluteus]
MSYPTSVTVVPTTTSPATSASPITISTSSISSNNSHCNLHDIRGNYITHYDYVGPVLSRFLYSRSPDLPDQNSYGSTAVVTTEISATTSVAVPTPSPVNNSSNTGAIVGGAIGGVVVIIVLLGLFFFCLRRRRRRNESDGNLDPDHIVSHSSGGRTQPQIDLGKKTRAPPYLTLNMIGACVNMENRSYLRVPPPQVSTTQHPHSALPRNTATLPPPPARGTPLRASVSNAFASSSGRGMKERETAATASRQGLVLPTQQEVDSEGSDAVQHQDAGQAPSEEGEPRDVPPAYESIGQ